MGHPQDIYVDYLIEYEKNLRRNANPYVFNGYLGFIYWSNIHSALIINHLSGKQNITKWSKSIQRSTFSLFPLRGEEIHYAPILISLMIGLCIEQSDVRESLLSKLYKLSEINNRSLRERLFILAWYIHASSLSSNSLHHFERGRNDINEIGGLPEVAAYRPPCSFWEAEPEKWKNVLNSTTKQPIPRFQIFRKKSDDYISNKRKKKITLFSAAIQILFNNALLDSLSDIVLHNFSIIRNR